MDYKYIQQLLERYWMCETTLEEEEILRAFFSQKEVPVGLLRYKDLFAYEQAEVRNDVLSDDFDERVLKMIKEPVPVKARVITMQQRLMPLFKAAAVVAIVLTLGNAMHLSMTNDQANKIGATGDSYQVIKHGTSVAMGDSATMDTLKQSRIESVQVQAHPLLK
ncbi:pyruvate ferredoxin oxidoreductase [Prevotella sp. oral taxon 376]|uniref:pyruvate ferredoxin oxidoreductase n=1 Tax=Prevotella sp. oral taxon 376 TaxID=712466 RepID=UPI000D1FC064|nr:pyruvate ferredoxin oxidoreductase [Prevotella sp. oral taxon 376]PTL33597.1 pyruvate ferredoxin oxidoreductase [Prevotella sp. oral taxon 376]